MYPREKLRSPTTFYIRKTGDDSKDGRTEANAMKSFNSLFTMLSRDYDLNRQTVTINIGPGTWTNETWTIYTDAFVNRGHIEIHGAGESGKDATILSASEGSTTGGRKGLSVEGPPGYYYVRVKDMQFINCTDCLSVAKGVILYATNITFGPHLEANKGYDLKVYYGSRVYAWGGTANAPATLTHAGGAKPPQYCYYVYENEAAIILDNVKISIKPDMTTEGFAYVSQGGRLHIYDATRTQFTGTLIGYRLKVYNTGKVYTSGRGETAFPGTIKSHVDTNTGAFIDKLPFITSVPEVKDRIIGGGVVTLGNISTPPSLSNTFGNIASASFDYDKGTRITFKTSMNNRPYIIIVTSPSGVYVVGQYHASCMLSGSGRATSEFIMIEV